MSHADEGIRRSTDYISDEERNYDSGRQKYQRERESPDGYNGREVDRFGRIRRSRSPQGGRYERSRSRSPGRDYRGGGGGGYRREGGYKGRGRYREDSRGYSSRRYGSARGDEQSSEREGGMGEQQGQDMGGVMDPFKLDLVVPFKYFCEWKRLQNRGKKLEQEELHRQYEEYRRQTLNKMYQQFFDEHKEEDWFVERYKPEEQKTRQQEVKRLKKRYYEEFLGQLERGELDNTCLDQSKAEENAMDEDAQVQETYTLFIKTIPPTVARAALESELKKVEGFDYLSLSEPNATRNYHRFGWAKFVEGTDMDSVLQTLSELKVGETTFTLSKHTKSSTAQQRTAPEQTSLPERIKSDLEVIREAVKQFDERTDSETFKMGDAIRARMDSELAANTKAKAAASKSASTPTSTSTPTPEDDSEAELAVAKKELDLSIEYLRKVHYYCYYCSAVYENREDFSRKCAPVHYRRPCSSATPPSSN
ncbi:Serrate RNA effector molecule-like protein, partial [Zancudomyces culisetae]